MVSYSAVTDRAVINRTGTGARPFGKLGGASGVRRGEWMSEWRVEGLGARNVRKGEASGEATAVSGVKGSGGEAGGMQVWEPQQDW